jgi:serine phosphatase RsbU (regulator of sigma subunit)
MAAGVACCALALAFIPTATAKRDHEKASSTTSSSQTSTAQTSTETTSTSAPPPAPATKESGGTASARHDDGGHEAQATRHSEKGKHSRSGGGEAAAASEQSDEGQAEPQGEAQAEDQVQAASKAGKGGGHKSEKGKKTKKEGSGSGKHGKGKAGEEEAEKEQAEKEQAEKEHEKKPEEKQSSNPTPTATVAASAPVSAPAPALLAPQVAQPAPVAASGVSKPARVVHRARAHRARSSDRARSSAPATLAAGVAAPAATTLAAKAVHAARHARHGTPGGGGGSGGGPVAPIVRTITKIVNVVPAAMRLLIAALLALALALAVRSRVSAVRARRLERQRGELLDDVGLLQAALLPATPERIGPVETSAAYEPAAGPGAGGDFYDVFALADGQLAVIVGDISGHGRQALPHTALVRFTLRAYLEAGLSPRDAVQTAGAVLERQLGGVFATVVVATYEPSERVMTYSCAGHPPPLVLGSDADARSLAAVTICTSPPIGVGMPTGARQTTISLPGRAQVCFYTDGVTEARIDSELFGVERLESALSELGPQATAPALLDRVAECADARPDDMAACVLSVAGGEEPPAVLAEELELDRPQASSTRTASFLHACGVADEQAAEVIRSASAAAGRAGKVVLEVRHGEHVPEVKIRRDQLAYLHARRADVAAEDSKEAAR